MFRVYLKLNLILISLFSSGEEEVVFLYFGIFKEELQLVEIQTFYLFFSFIYVWSRSIKTCNGFSCTNCSVIVLCCNEMLMFDSSIVFLQCVLATVGSIA